MSCRLQIKLVICAEISSIAALDMRPGAASPRPHAAINCIFISALNLDPARPLHSHHTLGRAKMQIFRYQAGFCLAAATSLLCLHHPSGSCLIMRGGDTEVSPPPPHHRHLAGVESRAPNEGSRRFHNYGEGPY